MHRRARLICSVLAVLALLVGCTGTVDLDSDPTRPPPPVHPVAVTQAPSSASTLVASDDPSALALAASRTFFASAQVVLLAPAADRTASLRAASVGISLGAPVLLTGVDDAGVAAELVRLGAGTVVPVGAVGLDPIDTTSMNVQPAPSSAADLGTLLGLEVTDVEAPAPGEEVAGLSALSAGEVFPAGQEAAAQASGRMPDTVPTERTDGAVLVVADGDPAQAPAVATALAAGADLLLATGDPRASSETVAALSSAAGTPLVGFGTTFGDEVQFAWQTATAATGTELPGGGQLVFDGKRYVALYGSPLTSALGLLGEQGVDATVQRAAETAAPYQALTPDTVVPALEIIVTVATGGAGEDGNYSKEWGPEEFLPLIEAAQAAGQYVVLDFQPGRSSFLDQVRLYESLLLYPHVGIALDPEWRLGPGEVHLVQIGSVGIDEVNAVTTYLADFVRAHHLPQKLVVLHQFQLRMIAERERLDLTRAEVALLIHADGQGPQGAKTATWEALHAGAPEGVHWGWKNFVDEDIPMLTPEQTYRVTPVPDFVSYQ